MNNDERIVQELCKTGKWSEDQVRLGLRANFQCEYCGLKFLESPENYKQWQNDHIVPTKKGGPHDSNNLALACRACNECFKGQWDPRTVTKADATRDDRIAAARNYIHQQKQKTEHQITREREIIGKR